MQKSMKLADGQAVDTQWSLAPPRDEGECVLLRLFSGSPKSHMMWLSIAFSILCGAVWGNSGPRCSILQAQNTFSVAHIASHAVPRSLLKIVIISIPHPSGFSLQTHMLCFGGFLKVVEAMLVPAAQAGGKVLLISSSFWISNWLSRDWDILDDLPSNSLTCSSRHENVQGMDGADGRKMKLGGIWNI